MTEPTEREWLEGIDLESVAEGVGDDSVWCALCARYFSVASITGHLVSEHGLDPTDIAEAPIIDNTEEEEHGD